MKIRKYQAGAIIYTPTPTGGQATSTQASASSSSASEKPEKITGTMLKEIMDQLKEDGLPADVEQILNYAARYLDKSSHLTDMSLFGGKDTEYNIKDWINITKLVKEAKWNKELYDDASDKLKEEDAWNDVATDTNGKIWLSNGKNLSKVSVSEYVKEREKLTESGYVPISYNTLGDFRSRYFGFDKNGMLEDMKAAVGMKSITKQLVDIVTKFEATEVSEYKFSQGTDKIRDASGRNYRLEAVKDGIEALTSGGPSGYYKLTQKTKVDKSNVEDALDYLWNSLGDSAQNAVRAKLAVEGDNPNNGDAVKAFLTDIISFHARNKVDVNFDSSATNYDPNGTGKKGGSSADKGDALTQMNPLALIASGYYGTPRKVNIIGKTSQVSKSGSIETTGYDIGAMIDYDRKTLDKQTVSSLLANAWELQAGNTGSITFGNRHITAEEAQALYWNGADHLNVVKLPATTDDNGNVIPNFELAQKVELLNKAAKGRTDAEVQDYIKSNLNGYDVKKNVDGIWEITNVPTISFLTFGAIASDDIFDFTDEEKLMLDKVSKEQGKMIVDIYNTLTRFNTLNPNKNTRALNVPTAGKNSFYKGNVFIPIEDQYAGFRVSGMDPYISKGDLSNPAEQIQLKQAAVANQTANGPLKTNFNQ